MLTHSDFQEVHQYSAGGVIGLDVNGIVVYANPRAIAMVFAGADFLGQRAGSFFVTAGEPDLFQHELTDKELPLTIDPVRAFVLVSSAIYTDETGETRTYLFIRDVSPLKKKENLLAYLNTATEALAQARDTNTALDEISRLIVPRFANWFSIDLLQNGQLEELVLAHEDPDMIQWARKYREAYPTDLNSNSSTARVIKTGIPSIVPVITPEMVRATVTNPGQLELIERLNLQSFITVAIFNKQTVVGIISFVSSATGYYYDEADLRFAQNFASHIGLALENTKLNEAAAGEINRRKIMESQLKLTQAHLQSALSSGLVGTWVYDIKKDILYADESLCRMFSIEFDAKGFKREVFARSIHPDDRTLIDDQRNQSIHSAKSYETEYRVIINGITYWIFARGQTEVNADNEPTLFTGVIIDVTQRKQAELEVKQNEQLFRFLADAIPHKMWTTGPDGRATYYNQGWYDYTGIKSFSELREQVWDIIHPDDRAIAAVMWPKAIQTGEQMEMEHRYRRHDGQYRWHLSRFSAHKDDSGNIKLWVGTSTDIHEQKENEQRKDEFLSIASHELKTPLTSIKAFNQLMKRMKADGQLGNFIDKSAEHIYRLERLIGDLLDVTKLNAGKMEYAAEPFDFKQMLVNSIENLQYNTTHKIILEDSPDVTFTGDQFRLEQVMNNLLSNAVKYSPKGEKILVNCKVEQNSVIVSVQDFGIGIARENLDRLFDRYYRVDNTAMRFEGLGLGLYISSEILKRHQGSFWIESEQGKGSTFYFRLPLTKSDKNQPPVKTNNYYRNEHIGIRYYKAQRSMEIDWTGFQDMASVQDGCMLMLDYLKQHKVDRIVNDNTHVQGNWSDAVEWVGNIWFPMMEQAGLKYFAHLFSPSTFSKLSAQKSIDIMNGIITTQYFTDITLARQWINSRPR